MQQATIGALVWISVVAVAILVLEYLITVWLNYLKDLKRANNDGRNPPSWASPVIFMVLVAGGFLFGTTLVLKEVGVVDGAATATTVRGYKQSVLCPNPTKKPLGTTKTNQSPVIETGKKNSS